MVRLSGLMAKPLLLIWGRGSAEREPLKDLVAVVQAIGLAHSKDGAVLLLARIFDERHRALGMTIKGVPLSVRFVANRDDFVFGHKEAQKSSLYPATIRDAPIGARETQWWR